MSEKSSTLGELEVLVLLAVLRCEGNAYGITVRDEIRHRANRPLALGTIYKTLMRLEVKGYLDSSTSAPEPKRGGRRRKLYRATGRGRTVLEHSMKTLTRMAQGLKVVPEFS
jgi:DNA-binding PadR family transcriptional regulator